MIIVGLAEDDADAETIKLPEIPRSIYTSLLWVDPWDLNPVGRIASDKPRRVCAVGNHKQHGGLVRTRVWVRHWWFRFRLAEWLRHTLLKHEFEALPEFKLERDQ